MQVDNYYDGYNPNGDIPLQVGDIMHDLVTTLAGGISSIGQREGISGSTISNMLRSPANISSLSSLMDSITDPTRPSAYLTYMQFDRSMKLVQGGTGAYQVTGDGNWTIIGTNGTPVKILEDGYIIVTIHDRSERPVWFDRFQVLFHRGKLKEETHYYPHGLPMANIGSAAAGMIPNDFRYQTNQFSQDAGLNWMDFNFRQYDPQIGRFLGIDPLADGYGQESSSPFAAMGNNPVSFTDPNGLATIWDWIWFYLLGQGDIPVGNPGSVEITAPANKGNSNGMGDNLFKIPTNFGSGGGSAPIGGAGGGGANRPPADAGASYAQTDYLNTQTKSFINSLVPFPIATPLSSINTNNSSNYTTNFESENNQTVKDNENWIESAWNWVKAIKFESSGGAKITAGGNGAADFVPKGKALVVGYDEGTYEDVADFHFHINQPLNDDPADADANTYYYGQNGVYHHTKVNDLQVGIGRSTEETWDSGNTTNTIHDNTTSYHFLIFEAQRSTNGHIGVYLNLNFKAALYLGLRAHFKIGFGHD